jgi:hypothetical protein
LNLHSIAKGLIASINPPTALTVQQSTSYTVNADFSQTPQYTLVQIPDADVQGLDQSALQLVERMNIQGLSKRVWVDGQFFAVVRAAARGGDIITDPTGTTWKITAVPEGWDQSGWCSFIMTMQNGSGT